MQLARDLTIKYLIYNSILLRLLLARTSSMQKKDEIFWVHKKVLFIYQMQLLKVWENLILQKQSMIAVAFLLKIRGDIS